MLSVAISNRSGVTPTVWRRSRIDLSRVLNVPKSRLYPRFALGRGGQNSQQQQPQHQQQQQQEHHHQQTPPHHCASTTPRPPRWLAGHAAAGVAFLLPLLPTWASDSFDYLTDTYTVDSSLAESPGILDTLLIVIITYFTVMLLYLWLSSFMDGDADGTNSNDSPSDSSSKRPPPANQGELPPGYGSFLDAHVRSYVDPHGGGGRRQVSALQELKQANPLEGEDLAALKDRLAAGAAEALEQQLRDCERLVRTKLLARKLGYAPNRNGSSNSSSNGVGSSEEQRRQQQQQEVAANINAMLSAAVLHSPGGLSSHEHRAAIDALIEQHLDQLLPAGGGQFSEELVVRQVMRRLVGTLVAEEALLLLEGVDQGKRVLEASGKGKTNQRWWALW